MITEYLKILNTIRLLSSQGRKPSCEFENGRIKVLNVSQSLIKRISYQGEERPDICPRQLYETYLTHNFEKPKSLAMLEGLYFEQKAIGATAGEAEHDLPRNKRTGERRVNQDRIDEAVKRFKDVAVLTGMEYQNGSVQVRGKKPFTDHNHDIEVFLKGTADIISPFKHKNIDYSPCCIDLKLSKDVTQTYCDNLKPWNPPVPWGNMAKVDKIQAYLYSIMFEMPFIYLVFDTKAEDADWDVFPVQTIYTHPDSTESKQRHRETIALIKWTIEKIVMWQEEGWREEPQPDACKNCPVTNCEAVQKIEYA